MSSHIFEPALADEAMGTSDADSEWRRKVRQSFLAEAEEAFAQYKTGGLHLTGEETRAWLRRWGDPGGAEAPECHD